MRGWFFSLTFSLLAATSLGAAQPDLSFKAADEAGFYNFDTGVLRGKLRLDGRSQGISELIHVPSQQEITYGGGHVGLFSPYRVFSTGTRYGHAARDWPAEPEILSDGAVEAHFPPGEDHPLEMTVIYRITSPDTLDLETIVTPTADMPGFEFFLSHYFGPGFDASVYVKPNRFAPQEPPGFQRADWNPLTDGNYLIYPRDRESVLLIFDGRWELPPNPVQWSVNRYLAGPLAMRRHEESGLTALVMAPPEDCFAVATPYNKTPPDGVAGHRSLYQSFFGRDVAAGQTVQARSRLVVRAGLSDEAAIGVYEQYLQQR
jgi:hypothetical protein